MKEEQDTCKDRGPSIEITNEEFERLKKIWDKKGYKFIIDKKTKEIIFV
tara:strand:- start:8341 stop:8487 length:147 start_codon:yes stop_codon:yes gene_type:complete